MGPDTKIPPINLEPVPRQFVPQTKVTNQQSLNLLGTISTLIFIAAIIAAGGMAFYYYSLENKISKLDEELNMAKKEFDPALIVELKNLSFRLAELKKIVQNHKAATILFAFFQANTAKTLMLDSLDLTLTDGVPSMKISGEGRSYNTIAFQADQFRLKKFFQNIDFSDVNLNEKGRIKFTASAMLNTDSINYRTLFGEQATGTVFHTP